MHKLVLALVLATTATASAQSFLFTMPYHPGEPLPQTVILRDNATGQKISTATIWGNRMVIRDAKDQLVGTAVVEADGSRTFYDPHGKIVEEPKGLVPEPRP